MGSRRGLALVLATMWLAVGGGARDGRAQASDPITGSDDRIAIDASIDDASERQSPWPRIGLGALALGALVALDEPTRDLALDVQGGFGDDLASFGHWYGDWHATAPWIAGGILAIGLASDGDRGVREAAAVVAGVLSASFANEGLNQASGRNRPDRNRGPWRFEPFNGHQSLGSGHTAYAFGIAAAIDEVTEGWVSTPFYAAAAITGLSRIYDDRHWLSDVAVGAAIGLAVGRRGTALAARALGVSPTTRDESSGSTPPTVRLETFATSRSVGLRLRF